MIIFESVKSRVEFYSPSIDVRLRCIIYIVAGFMDYNFNRPTIITHLLRTQEEQDKIYGSNPDPKVRESYLVSPWKSVHQAGRGVDLSIRYLKTSQLKHLKDFINRHIPYNSTNPNYKTIKIHDIGHGNHAHIQVDWQNETKIVKGEKYELSPSG